MIKITFLFLIVCFFASCKKEGINYPNASINSCELCAWAKSVEGKYIGMGSGINQAPTGTAYYNVYEFHDSLIIDVKQIWKEEFSPSMDSTIMVFKLTYTMQSDSTKHQYREIYFNTSEGKSIGSNSMKYDMFSNNRLKCGESFNNHGQILPLFGYNGLKIQ